MLIDQVNLLLEVEKSDNEVEGIADCYHEISKIYQRKKDFKTAEEYARKAVSIYDTIPKKQIIHSSNYC